MFIVTLHNDWGSQVESSEPMKVWGPFTTLADAKKCKDMLYAFIETSTDPNIKSGCWPQIIKIPTSCTLPTQDEIDFLA